MRSFEDFGAGLHVEYGRAPVIAKNDTDIFHMHPQYELLLVWSKTKNTTIINGKFTEIDYPMAVLAAPFTMHHTYFTEASEEWVERCVLYFDDRFLRSFGERVPPALALLGNSGAAILDIRGFERQISDLVYSLVNGKGRVRADEDMNEMQCLIAAVILQGLWDYTQRGRPAVQISEKNYVIDVMEYVTVNLEKNLTIPEIADHFFISRDKLCRDFRRHTQMNVGDFIAAARLNLAKKLLTENRLTIKEISAACGFENDVYFYTFFRRHEGCTPKAFAREEGAKRATMRQSAQKTNKNFVKSDISSEKEINSK